MKINTLKATIVAASALTIAAIAAPASAGVVTFQTSGQWANWVGGSSVNATAGGGDATIKWGNTSWYHWDKSSYTLDAQNVNGLDLSDGETSSMFTLGEFTHDNANILGNGITAVDLLLTTKIFVDGDHVADRTFVWNFQHDETADDGSCPYGGSGWSNCNDKLTVSYGGVLGGDSFQVGQDLYTFDIAGFQVKQGAKWVDQDTFITKEDKTNSAKIRGQLSMTTLTSAVPEPSTWAMMLVGFFGAGTMLRSTRRKELAAIAA